ncbi:hypothetical protein DFS34DRAFT_591960 [Phlyctochytrium arcticum]|nr:hypothetical protein DFS34DRAFT_591960 [Phlyctochytrium arcticum]
MMILCAAFERVLSFPPFRPILPKISRCCRVAKTRTAQEDEAMPRITWRNVSRRREDVLPPLRSGDPVWFESTIPPQHCGEVPGGVHEGKTKKSARTHFRKILRSLTRVCRRFSFASRKSKSPSVRKSSWGRLRSSKSSHESLTTCDYGSLQRLASATISNRPDPVLDNRPERRCSGPTRSILSIKSQQEPIQTLGAKDVNQDETYTLCLKGSELANQKALPLVNFGKRVANHANRASSIQREIRRSYLSSRATKQLQQPSLHSRASPRSSLSSDTSCPLLRKEGIDDPSWTPNMEPEHETVQRINPSSESKTEQVPSVSALLEAQMHALNGTFKHIRALQVLKKEDLTNTRRSLQLHPLPRPPQPPLRQDSWKRPVTWDIGWENAPDLSYLSAIDRLQVCDSSSIITCESPECATEEREKLVRPNEQSCGISALDLLYRDMQDLTLDQLAAKYF